MKLAALAATVALVTGCTPDDSAPLPSAADCRLASAAVYDYTADSRGDGRDPVEIARPLFTVDDGDVVEEVRPRSEDARAVRLARGGRTIAVVHLRRAAGAWLVVKKERCA